MQMFSYQFWRPWKPLISSIQIFTGISLSEEAGQSEGVIVAETECKFPLIPLQAKLGINVKGDYFDPYLEDRFPLIPLQAKLGGNQKGGRCLTFLLIPLQAKLGRSIISLFRELIEYFQLIPLQVKLGGSTILKHNTAILSDPQIYAPL